MEKKLVKVTNTSWVNPDHISHIIKNETGVVVFFTTGEQGFFKGYSVDEIADRILLNKPVPPPKKEE